MKAWSRGNRLLFVLDPPVPTKSMCFRSLWSSVLDPHSTCLSSFSRKFSRTSSVFVSSLCRRCFPWLSRTVFMAKEWELFNGLCAPQIPLLNWSHLLCLLFYVATNLCLAGSEFRERDKQIRIKTNTYKRKSIGVNSLFLFGLTGKIWRASMMIDMNQHINKAKPTFAFCQISKRGFRANVLFVLPYRTWSATLAMS